jgi:pimeloyl-ACP methyl ester carboxylesterase
MQVQKPRDENQSSDGAILLVPGFCSPAEVLRPLARRLERKLERPTRIISLGAGCGDIRDLAERAHVELAQALAAGARGRIDVVGHSMGGVVAAYLLKCLDQGRYVRRAVTLGTPHHGLAMARLGALMPGPFGRTLRQLRPGSSLLGLLARLTLPEGSELVSIAGGSDGVVPPHAARLPHAPGQRNIELPDVDHLGLVFTKHAARTLFDVLEQREHPPASAFGAARAPARLDERSLAPGWAGLPTLRDTSPVRARVA